MAIETSGLNICVSGKKRETLTAEATLRFFEPLAEIRQVCARACASVSLYAALCMCVVVCRCMSLCESRQRVHGAPHRPDWYLLIHDLPGGS